MAVQRVSRRVIERVAGLTWAAALMGGGLLLAPATPAMAQQVSLLNVFRPPQPAPPPPTNGQYKKLLKRTAELLHAGRDAEALSVAREAVHAQPHHFRGHYDMAMALMNLGQWDKAEAAMAMARAQPMPRDEDRAAVDKLAGTLRLRQEGVRLMREAEAERAEGRIEKAAALYEQAWSNGGRYHTEAVFKAAALYSEHLTQPVAAARLLRQIVALPKSAAVEEQAKTALDKLTPALREIAAGHLRVAATQHGAEALQHLQAAEDADPEDLSIHIRRARVISEGSDLEALQPAIQALSQRGLAIPVVLADLPAMKAHLSQPSFRAFMTRLLGASRVDELVAQLGKGTSAGRPAGSVWKDCEDCPELISVPVGHFSMGSNQSVIDDEGPMHVVSLASFAIGRTEVTQAQWRTVMHQAPPGYFEECGPTCPVERVTWSDVQLFLQKLSLKTGHRYRLPSEAEWEYACQAGEHHTYCGSEHVDEVAWYGSSGGSASGGNSEQTIHPVAQKKPNAWGLFDMSGNVWEWVADCANPNYVGAPTDGSAWLVGDCSRRVGRGGGWSVYEHLVRSSARGDYAIAASTRSTSLGFRVVRALP